MNILMIEVPTAERDGSVPFGLLYAASAAYRNGHNIRILDLVKDNLGYADAKKVIEDFSPDLIGLGGITSCYKNCKELVGNIKKYFKNIPVVVGGVLSSVSDLLLEKAGVDFIVHGEGEISFLNLIDAIENGKDISVIRGISFLEKEKIQRTSTQPPISNLDDIPMPEYALLDMDKYLSPLDKWVNFYFKDDREKQKEIRRQLSDRKMFSIITTRGCPYRCIFCYRHHKGWRQHSAQYVINTIKHLRDRYGASVFQINDELTTANKKWVLEFCDRVITEKLDIYFIILSSKVDRIDKEMLLRLKQAGCLMVNYGYESGSDIILKEIKKGSNRKQALEAGLLTKEVGIKNIPEIMIGFPSETDRTISETIDFLKQLDTWIVSINTPIPFPETPLWQYAVEHNLIKDKEDFVLNYRRGLFVNFTRFSDKKLLGLVEKVRYDVRLNWLKKRKQYGRYLAYLLQKLFIIYIKPILPKKLYIVFKKIHSKFFKS